MSKALEGWALACGKAADAIEKQMKANKNKPEPIKVGAIVRQIVDRCHCGDSNRKVIKYVVSCLRNKYQTFAALPKDQRRNLMLQAIQAHSENRGLYRQVMRGF